MISIRRIDYLDAELKALLLAAIAGDEEKYTEFKRLRHAKCYQLTLDDIKLTIHINEGFIDFLSQHDLSHCSETLLLEASGTYAVTYEPARPSAFINKLRAAADANSAAAMSALMTLADNKKIKTTLVELATRWKQAFSQEGLIQGDKKTIRFVRGLVLLETGEKEEAKKCFAEGAAEEHTPSICKLAYLQQAELVGEQPPIKNLCETSSALYIRAAKQIDDPFMLNIIANYYAYNDILDGELLSAHYCTARNLHERAIIAGNLNSINSLHFIFCDHAKIEPTLSNRIKLLRLALFYHDAAQHFVSHSSTVDIRIKQLQAELSELEKRLFAESKTASIHTSCETTETTSLHSEIQELKKRLEVVESKLGLTSTTTHIQQTLGIKREAIDSPITSQSKRSLTDNPIAEPARASSSNNAEVPIARTPVSSGSEVPAAQRLSPF